MSNPTAYELIAAVIDDGLSNTVMDAAAWPAAAAAPWSRP